MKILYLSHRIPYPPNKGDKIRSFYTIKHLAVSHRVDLICLADNPSDLRFQNNLKEHCREVFVVPLRTTFGTARGLAYLAFGKALSTGYFYSRKVREILEKMLRVLAYDAVICFSSSMAEYIFRSLLFHNRQPVSATRRPLLIMDFCDVDSHKWLQYSQHSRFPRNLIYRAEYRQLLKYEKWISQLFDHSVFVSQQEADLFSRLCPESRNLSVIPNGVDHKYFSSGYQSASHCRGPMPCTSDPILLFTGAMDYTANIDGVIWFCNRIFPTIKTAVPEVKFYIVGSNPRREVKKLENCNGVRVTGVVEDIRPYHDAAQVCVVPLRLARGVQNKVLEAMAMGKAVVTTPEAIQGIEARDQEHLIVAKDPADFAKATVMLLKHPRHRYELGVRARRYVEKRHDWQTNMRRFEDLLAHG